MSSFEAADRICILTSLYKNKTALFQREQTAKEKVGLLPPSLGFIRPHELDANTDRRFIEQFAVQSPPRRCWRNEFTARFQTSRPVSKRSPHFSLDDDRIGCFTTWLDKKKRIGQPSETDGLSVCMWMLVRMSWKKFRTPHIHRLDIRWSNRR